MTDRARIFLKLALATLLLLALAVPAWWALRPQPDRYDYAAAFETGAVEAGVPLQVDVTAFAGRPRAVVESLLGRPQGCEASMYGERCRYAREVEIVYVDGRADWMTVRYPYGRIALAPAALAAIGLSPVEPHQVGSFSLRWQAIGGLHDVELVGDESGVLYARIKAIHG
ncbi:MAG: hypothetical protein PHP86_01885 [Nevskiales bacterium]|nr:hypothetical protein [Nevskiales bacterium]